MPVSPNSTLQIGLVGGGMVGQLHAQALSLVPGIKIVALADLRPNLAHRVAAKYGIKRTYVTHLELLGDNTVDAVAVVVRRAATSAVVRDCLLAGKHVYSEKPMAMTALTATELVDLARQRELFYTVGFPKRHDAGMAVCRELLARFEDTDELGRLMFVRGWNHTGKDRELDAGLVMTDEVRPTGLTLDAETPGWLPTGNALSYDRFVNTYCHDINALHYLFSESPQVRAAELDVLGGQSVILGYSNFIMSMAFTLSELMDWSKRGEWDEGFEFHFEAGRLQISFAPPLYRSRAARVHLRRGSDPVEIICDGASNVSAFTLQAKNFLSDLRNGRASRSSAANSLQDMVLIEQIWKKNICAKQELASRSTQEDSLTDERSTCGPIVAMIR